ncbi:hypothetical protein ASG52_24635 [Methylobacterium sp. Leaf456]|uniref:hypothetical protein n=1 Tax=Methylobacterium sp. Leaf456 TaxID=1736382 RepID=UPI0006F7588E|nr:hypothetical protein [Methylobacterium sp. Leaf456]KQT56108.1 hypothetical protein ASG52_24635 [Methylobacterium sp. Leaf456]
MTHVRPLPVLTVHHADGDRVPFHADPILAAIEAHEEAYAAFQVAPEGEASLRAFDAYNETRKALLATPCATRAGMLCLIRHLRWWMGEEAPFAADYQHDFGIAQARESDLSRCLGVERIERLPLALPSGRLLAPVLDLKPVSASTSSSGTYPAPVPTRVQFGRAMSRAADVVAGLVIIVGGCGLVGFASLF